MKLSATTEHQEPAAQPAPEKPPYKPCDGKRHFCPPLERRLQDGYKKGLNFIRIMNVNTFEDCDPIISYKESPTDRGIAINFCPFCGKQLNRTYRRSAKRAAGGAK